VLDILVHACSLNYVEGRGGRIVVQGLPRQKS
jgi:hypothetical protein